MSPTTTASQPHLLTTPIRRHVPQPRSRRMIWIVMVGIVLLVSSVVGASVLINEGLLPQAPQRKAAEPHPLGVSAQGLVDADPKVADLNPTQQGRIVWLIEEGKHAKKEDVLLRIDNGAALKKVEAAKAALAAAQAKLEVAKKGPEQLEITKQQIELAIEEAKQQKKIAQSQFEQTKEAFKLKQVNQRDVDIAEANLKRAGAALSGAASKLPELRLKDPQLDIAQADALVAAEQAQLEGANWLLQQHELKAPFDGTVLRVLVSVGEVFGGFQQLPAIQFCPNTPRVIRAEVLQEWAHLVKEGQEVIIEDDTKVGHKWKGRVKKVSDWITERRVKRIEPLAGLNDVRTLECIIEVLRDENEAAANEHPLRIGQRVRVTILQDGKVKATDPNQ